MAHIAWAIFAIVATPLVLGGMACTAMGVYARLRPDVWVGFAGNSFIGPRRISDPAVVDFLMIAIAFVPSFASRIGARVPRGSLALGGACGGVVWLVLWLGSRPVIA